jgi:hypothetical protein
MLGEAALYAAGLLGLWWSLPGELVAEKAIKKINSIKQSYGLTSSSTPAVLQPSTADSTKISALHKVRPMLYTSTACSAYCISVSVSTALSYQMLCCGNAL